MPLSIVFLLLVKLTENLEKIAAPLGLESSLGAALALVLAAGAALPVAATQRYERLPPACEERTLPFFNKITSHFGTEHNASVSGIVRVLGYPKFHLAAADQEELLGDFLPFAEIIEADLPTGEIPICRDKHDQQFLESAVAGKADVRVTGDADLLVLAEQSPIPNMTPADFHRRIGR